MKFKVRRTWRNITYDSPPVSELSAAMAMAVKWLDEFRCKTLTIVRDSEGADHPDNAGRWFLHRIVK
jgi:hypothetical protein